MVILVTGGARSGKSSFAEAFYKDKNDVVYIATTRVEDEEMKQRVHLHKSSRPQIWRTFEGTYGLEASVGSEKNYLLDCLTILTSNIMFDISKDMNFIDAVTQTNIENSVFNEIQSLVKRIKEMELNLVMVTNEVGCSLVPENHIGRVYRDIIGRVNQRVARIVDEVYAVFCGIPLKLK